MKLLRVFSGAIFIVAIAALNASAGDKKDVPPPVVPVSKPIQRTVTDYENFTGHTNAKESVTIQPRVTGFLDKITFKEGAEVKKGDVLFEIDPRPYQAMLAAAKAKVTQSEAGLRLARATNARIKNLAKLQPNAVSKEEIEQNQEKEELAAAVLDFEKANLQMAMLNLDWTVIRAPISGRIGKANLTLGNLVEQDKTKLTTLDSSDPMHVCFELDERTYLRLRGGVQDGKPSAKSDAGLTVQIGLASDEGYPRRGNVDFVDSRVDVKTGGIQVRAVLANPKAKDGIALLLPGMLVRARMPIGQPYQALLVIDRAVVTTQGAKFLWVVDAENKVDLRSVMLGQLQSDGLRVVERGLKLDDRVVIGNFKAIRARKTIQPDLVAMPTLK